MEGSGMQKQFKTAWMRSPQASGDKHEGAQVRVLGCSQGGGQGREGGNRKLRSGGAFKITSLGFLNGRTTDEGEWVGLLCRRGWQSLFWAS